MKLGWIPPAVIVISIWYFMIMPNIPSTPVIVNSPMDLKILVLVISIMALIIALMPTEVEV